MGISRESLVLESQVCGRDCGGRGTRSSGLGTLVSRGYKRGVGLTYICFNEGVFVGDFYSWVRCRSEFVDPGKDSGMKVFRPLIMSY